LVGDPYCRYVEVTLGQFVLHTGQSRSDQVPYLGGIVLDEAGGGEVLGELSVRDRHYIALLV
jgi:hypothetical protein